MPLPQSTDTHPPESWTDACPNCVVNTEPPKWLVTLRASIRCGYRCSDCLHAWTTDWSR